MPGRIALIVLKKVKVSLDFFKLHIDFVLGMPDYLHGIPVVTSRGV